MTPDQLDQATLWVDLSWIRLAIDIAVTALLLLAATASDATSPRVVSNDGG